MELLLTQKVELEQSSKKLFLPPYVHRLVKSSRSSLSSKCFKVFVECLSFETSGRFSRYPSSGLEYTIRDDDMEFEGKHETPQISDACKMCLKSMKLELGRKESPKINIPPILSLWCSQQGAYGGMNP